MMRFINVVLITLVIGAATWTYTIKHDAEARLSEIRATEREIDTSRETIEMLKADWAYLTRPQRIKALSEQFSDQLQLDVTETHQIVQPDELPDAPVRDAAQGIEEIIAQQLADELTTGSIDSNNGAE